MAVPASAQTDVLSATRESYDKLAIDYAAHFADAMAGMPVERAVLGLFAEVVTGPVLDVGCGTGLATGILHDLGVAIAGVDLSPGMLEVARQNLPSLPFDVASMLELPHADGSFAGVMSWYSTIHIPDDLLPTALSELARVLRPGGHLLLGFQVGDVPRHMTSALGHDLELVFHRRQPDRMAELLAAADVPVETRIYREAMLDEPTPQAFLLARKPATP